MCQICFIFHLIENILIEKRFQKSVKNYSSSIVPPYILLLLTVEQTWFVQYLCLPEKKSMFSLNCKYLCKCKTKHIDFLRLFRNKKEWTPKEKERMQNITEQKQCERKQANNFILNFFFLLLLFCSCALGGCCQRHDICRWSKVAVF